MLWASPGVTPCSRPLSRSPPRSMKRWTVKLTMDSIDPSQSTLQSWSPDAEARSLGELNQLTWLASSTPAVRDTLICPGWTRQRSSAKASSPPSSPLSKLPIQSLSPWTCALKKILPRATCSVLCTTQPIKFKMIGFSPLCTDTAISQTC